MPEERIVITIDKDGSITAKTSGFMGETCLEALSELLDLKTNCSRFDKTHAYYQKQVTKNSIRQKTGLK